MLGLLVAVRLFTRALGIAWREPEFRSLGGIVGGMLVVGTIFYHFAEGWRWLDSLYFCVVTLATVGYGDFSPKTDVGKIFTMIYIVLGVGLLVSLLTSLAQALIAARAQARERRRRRASEP